MACLANRRDGQPQAARGAIDALLANYTDRLAAVGGDTARLAAESKLVDGLLSADQWEDFLKQKVGASDDGKSAWRAALAAYLGSEQPTLEVPMDAVGVVVVQGAIVDGDQPPGIAGGETIARLLKQARDEDSIKALVLRVDSPGGASMRRSAFAARSSWCARPASRWWCR